MRRLRALFSARGVGTTAASARDQAPGRVDRRRLLGLLGAAPVVLPAIARAGAGPRQLLVGGADVHALWWSFVAVDRASEEFREFVTRAGLSPADGDLAVVRAAHRELPDFPSHRLIPGNIAAGVPARLVCLPTDMAWTLVDDVGSGP